MNNIIKLVAAFCAVSAVYEAGTFQLWDREEGKPQVQTGLDNNSET